MRSRFSASATSIRSASPRVPTSEKDCSEVVGARSPRTRRGTRACAPRARPPASRRQAGSSLRNVYLTKCRSATRRRIGAGKRAALALRPASGLPWAGAHCARVPVFVDVSGRRDAAHRGARGGVRCARATTSASSRRSIRPTACRRACTAGRRRPSATRPGELRRRWGARSASRPTARSPTWRSPRTPSATLRTELRTGGYDVVHLHEPVAPMVGWDALGSAVGAAARRHVPHLRQEPSRRRHRQRLRRAGAACSRLGVRIAVSEAAAWTARRFYGGRYRIIPNGVRSSATRWSAAASGGTGPLRIAFVGQAVERKGLPILLRAFEALREHVAGRADARRRQRRGGRAAARRLAAASRRWARSTTTQSTPRCAPPTSCARRRSAARASAWS